MKNMRGFILLCVLLFTFDKVLGNSSKWYESMSLYQIYPRSFKDSDGDGTGDLKGIESKLEHLVESQFNAFWLSPIYKSPMNDFGYDISNYREIDPIFGTMKDFESLVKKAHDLSLKIILDLVPNHSSHEHEWFQKSVKKIEPYTDYYVWHEGKIINGTRYPPNNWVSIFYGSGWTWNQERQAYYFHQFLAEQPDLNYRNPHVVEEIKNVMRFWLNKGVDGFRIDAVPHLFEVKELYDEPLSGKTNDSNSYDYTNHIYTSSQQETYEMVQQWRNVLDEYKDVPRIMMIEAYASLNNTINYYNYGATFPFNFHLMFLGSNSTAKDFKSMVDGWMGNMPNGSIANWVAGNHDNSRLTKRFGNEYSLAIMSLVLLMPGAAITYNGDEIGMEDTFLTWKETKDLPACKIGEKNYEKATRDPERTPFQWDASTSAGFSNNSNTWLPVNNNYKLLNLAAQKEANQSYYKNFLKITSLRKYPAVKQGSLETKVLNNNNVFAFSRILKNEKSVYVVINVSYEPQTVNLKTFDNIPSHLQLYSTVSGSQNIKDGDTINSDNLQIGARNSLILVSI